ncbi:MAG: SpoIIE family protein phosphatase [Acidobacteria bacterium]|nr:SpoIIE family protein phosphatase [Acidobacteriota bacterium]
MITSVDILNAKILIVDDLDANIALVEGILRVAGYTAVHSTSDPSEVCLLHSKNHYSLILLDLQMPGLDGFEVMEGLKAMEADGYLPVLVITAQPGHKLRALATGAKDFISKPFDIAELRARVQNILEVRLLHLAAKHYGKVLEETVRQLEESREQVRLQAIEEGKQLEREIVSARQTQQSLLPRAMPEIENYRVMAFNQPTRYLGADFYDFLQLRSREWLGVLADVSGKGLPAALFSSMVLGALNTELRSGTEPHEALNRANRLFCERSLPTQFVTLFLYVLSPDGVGRFISAGHTPVYLYRAATGKIESLVSDAYMLGMFEFATYRPRRFRMERGDIMVIYSDGLTKAENPRRELFGDDRLTEIIRRVGPAGGEVVRRCLMKAIDEFTLGIPQADDVTFVIVEKHQ